jgi:putative endonuclease
MFYIYVIKSKRDGSIYTGYTKDLIKRMKEHNTGKSIHTKNKYPYELIYYESYKSMAAAKFRENNLKRFAQAYSQLKKRIKNSLE